MGMLKKIKFWKKKNNNTLTKVDARVSSEDPQTCDVSTVTMDTTVMWVTNIQRPEWMDGGAAAKEEYER
jgi:hypothetical protein